MSLTAAIMIFLSGAASSLLAVLLHNNGELIERINEKLESEDE